MVLRVQSPIAGKRERIMRPNALLFTFIFGLLFIPFSHSLPFVILHGVASTCVEISQFTQVLQEWSGSPGTCIEIGNGSSSDSWLYPLSYQVTVVCDRVRSMEELIGGYNLVGVSQGSLIARGVLEFCDGPQVKNLISLAGPQAGVASIPHCGPRFFCKIINVLLKLLVYTKFVQDHLAPSNYLKLPNSYDKYLRHCSYLPKLNNEIEGQREPLYKERFTSLENLILIMNENDKVLVPRETAWFGYFPDGSFGHVLPTKETRLYMEDWIGLKTLDEAGKVKYYLAQGDHTHLSANEAYTFIVPILGTPKNLSTLSYNNNFIHPNSTYSFNNLG